jgi:hypothetical protein
MSSLCDYFEWRGDLRFAAAPFNPVDNIIFSILAYYPWDGIVGGIDGVRRVLLRDAAETLLSRLGEGRTNLTMTFMFKGSLQTMLTAIRDSPRFANVTVSGYVNHFDKQIEKQFSAVVFIPDRGAEPYIAFRGTDDTIIGWKEDFNMIFSDPIPAQTEAVDYLEKAARLFKGKFNLGGHSKGGNLAVYAASFCSRRIKARIRNIYTNDGPGLSCTVTANPGYREIVPKIVTFIPQTSVVGLLFEHKNDYFVVESAEKGLLQHDPFSWKVKRDTLSCLNAVSRESQYINKALMSWLAGMSDDRRRHFINALFAILEETGASSISDLTADWFANSAKIIKALQHYDKETKDMLLSTFASLLEIVRDGFTSILKKSVKHQLHG